MNIEEYKRRINKTHSVTGIPSYWEDLEKMTGERDLLRASLNLEQQLTELLASERNQWKKLALRAYKLAVGNAWDPTVFRTFEEGLNAYEGANHE